VLLNVSKTFRVSDTVKWRWKIVPGQRTGVWERRLPITVRQCIERCRPIADRTSSGWRRRYAPCRKNTSDADWCGLSASWCTIWSPIDGRWATSGAASEPVSIWQTRGFVQCSKETQSWQRYKLPTWVINVYIIFARSVNAVVLDCWYYLYLISQACISHSCVCARKHALILVFC